MARATLRICLLVFCVSFVSRVHADEEFGARARVETKVETVQAGRASSVVPRRDIEERLPRSAPDALRYEPGVYVQQTAHGQGSPYVRGLTGQQVLLMFDGIRLNNGIYRQGPNQYFFTVDTQTIDHIDVLRGSASTLYGSDAIGGMVQAVPRAAYLDPSKDIWKLTPRVFTKTATADSELGGRIESGAQLGAHTAALAGLGYRRVGLLESGGIVHNPNGAGVPLVPRFAADERTQLGTGFNEATFDLRVEHQLQVELKAIFALYGYRQTDAPRTDQCPPPYSPASECLSIEEQFRTLGYASLRGYAGDYVRDFELTLSWQRQHERRQRERPEAFARNTGRDDVNTVGVAYKAYTPTWQTSPHSQLRLRYGVDAYHDTVSSGAWLTFTDLGDTRQDSRGQYLDGSRYVLLGAFSEAEVRIFNDWVFRVAGRAALADATASADPESGSFAVDEQWTALLGRAGIEAPVAKSTTLIANVDQGFRAPNLDDLTSRQQAGPGFQFENANLTPERSWTLEGGIKTDWDIWHVEGWLFHTWITNAITRSLRLASDCPPETPQCLASWSRYQLINADEASRIYGAEALASVELPWDWSARTTLSWARGSAPNLSPRPADPAIPYNDEVPLSRIPPLNGTVELRWRQVQSGVYVGPAMRWAAAQHRLAPTDLSDSRIPLGGTPGFMAFDLRAGWRYQDKVLCALVFENIFDAAYRVHGSSVNGPGRGLLLATTLGF